MIRMANQIAAYFEAYPRTEALDGIAKHIQNAWTPRMRQQLADYIEAGAEDLSPAGGSGAGAQGESQVLNDCSNSSVTRNR